MTQSFYDQLVAETASARDDFLAIPLVREALAEGASGALYVEFLANAYHHVKQTCPLMGLALSRCGEADQPFRTGLLSYIEEEKGHEAWILDDIAVFGGDREAVRSALPPFPVRMMVAYGAYAVEHLSPYALLGMVHVLEGLSVNLASAAAATIGRSLGRGLQPGADGRVPGFTYLTTHGHLDESHVAFFADLLADIDSPERRCVVIQAAKDFYRLYGNIFRELGHAA